MRLLIPGVNPTPWKAPDNIPTRGKGGKTFCKSVTPVVVKDYQAQIKEAMARLYPDITPTPKGQQVQLRFRFWRNLGYRAQRCDATNLQKSTEDALQGVLFENDRDVFYVSSAIVEQAKGIDDLICIDFRSESDVDMTRPTIDDGLCIPWAVSGDVADEPNTRDIDWEI